MTKRYETDADTYERLMQNARTSRLIDALDWEMRQGDATSRKRAENDLRNHGLLIREIAAVKRWIKR